MYHTRGSTRFRYSLYCKGKSVVTSAKPRGLNWSMLRALHTIGSDSSISALARMGYDDVITQIEAPVISSFTRCRQKLRRWGTSEQLPWSFKKKKTASKFIRSTPLTFIHGNRSTIIRCNNFTIVRTKHEMTALLITCEMFLDFCQECNKRFQTS